LPVHYSQRYSVINNCNKHITLLRLVMLLRSLLCLIYFLTFLCICLFVSPLKICNPNIFFRFFNKKIVDYLGYRGRNTISCIYLLYVNMLDIYRRIVSHWHLVYKFCSLLNTLLWLRKVIKAFFSLKGTTFVYVLSSDWWISGLTPIKYDSMHRLFLE
jgi:hypothetical protein